MVQRTGYRLYHSCRYNMHCGYATSYDYVTSKCSYQKVTKTFRTSVTSSNWQLASNSLCVKYNFIK